MNLDDAPVIGEVGPRADGLDAPFWDALSRDELLIQRCPACATWIWSPQWVCPSCRRLDPEWVATPAEGTVYTWTRTHQTFVPMVADQVPYLTVLVELPDAGGVRLLGLLLGDQARDPVIGERVVGVVQPACEANGQVPVLRWSRPD